MDRNALLDLTRQLLECPTAPTFEARIRSEIRALLEDLSLVTIVEDPFGNLIALYQGSDAPVRFAFTAHMDHPGWRLQPDKEFLGAVPERLLVTAPIREFGDFGVWDLPAFLLKGDRIHSRACDDLIGCVTIVAMLRDHWKRAPNGLRRKLVQVLSFGWAIELRSSTRQQQDIS